MLEFIALLLGILWLGMGVFEGKIIGLFRSFGTRQYQLILKGAGYASAGVIALFSSTLDSDTMPIVLIFATIIFVATWFFLRQIGNEQKVKLINHQCQTRSRQNIEKHSKGNAPVAPNQNKQ